MNRPITKFGKIEEEIRELELEEAVPLPFIVDNFLWKRGGEITGSIDMTGQPIKNLPDPIDGGDAATKNYVDTSQGHSFFRRSPNNGYVASKDLDMDEHRLLNLRMPVDNLEAANKLFTEITVNDLKNRLENNNPFFLNTNKHKARSGIDMQNFKIEGLPMPVNDKDVSNKIYVDTLTEDRRRKVEANNPFTFQNGEYIAKGKLNLRGFKIENVENPENPKDVVNLEYFKTNTTHAFLRKNGGFEAQEHIYLKNKKLGGLRDPIADREAANKKYVDEETEKVKEYVDEKTEEIKAAGGGGGAPGNVDAAALNVVKTELEKNQAFNTRNQKTFNARGNINMKQKTIRNLPEPTDDTDAASKGYVDEQDENIKTELSDYKESNNKKNIEVGKKILENFYNTRAALIGITKKYAIKSLIDKLENDYLKSPGVKQKLINGSGVYKILIHRLKSNAKEEFRKEYLKDPPDEALEFNDLFEKFLKQFYEKFNNLDDATKDDEAALIKVMEKEIFKFKIDENILDPSFIKLNGHFLAAGEVDMNENKIKNLAPPIEDNDAVTKAFLKDELKNVSGGNAGAADFGDIQGRKLINVGDPENPKDGVNKKYVDAKTKDIKTEGPFNKLNGYYIASSEFDMGIKKIKNLALPFDDSDAANKQYVDDEIKEVDDKTENNKNDIEELRAFHVRETTQNKNMRGFKIVNVGNPEDGEDATNKNYVDNEINNIDQAFLKENGYYVARNVINMGYKNIKNLADPTEENDAAPKSYIDKTLTKINKTLKFLNEEDFFNQISDLLKNNPFSRQGDGTLKLLAPLDLQRKRLFNGQPPTDQKDLVIKSYVDDNFLSRDKEEIIKEDVYRVLRNDIEKMLSFSSFFIYGEAEGPIIGMDKIQNSNFRAPHFSPGNPVAADVNRNIIKLTSVFLVNMMGVLIITII